MIARANEPMRVPKSKRIGEFGRRERLRQNCAMNSFCLIPQCNEERKESFVDGRRRKSNGEGREGVGNFK